MNRDHESPEGLKYSADLAASDAAILRAMAAKTVRDDPRVGLGQARELEARRWTTGVWLDQGKFTQRSVRRQTYSHLTSERGFS